MILWGNDFIVFHFGPLKITNKNVFITYFIYISNAIPFPGFLFENLLSSPLTPAYKPTHSHFLALPFPYTGA